jgi:hypothetical protein
MAEEPPEQIAGVKTDAPGSPGTCFSFILLPYLLYAPPAMCKHAVIKGPFFSFMETSREVDLRFLVAHLIPFVTKFYDLQMENESNGGACQLH